MSKERTANRRSQWTRCLWLKVSCIFMGISRVSLRGWRERDGVTNFSRWEEGHDDVKASMFRIGKGLEELPTFCQGPQQMRPREIANPSFCPSFSLSFETLTHIYSNSLPIPQTPQIWSPKPPSSRRPSRTAVSSRPSLRMTSSSRYDSSGYKQVK